MKRYTRKRISKMLKDIGACWAHMDTKHLRPDDPPFLRKKRIKTYHIYPDKNFPKGFGILRFRNLSALAEYIKTRKVAPSGLVKSEE